MKLKVTWKDNANNETEQRVYVASDIAGTDRVLAATVAPDVTEVTISVPGPFINKHFFVTVVALEGEKSSVAQSFYVTKDGLMLDIDYQKRARELNKKYSDVKPAVTAERIERPGPSFNFLSQSAICGELANGMIMNSSGSDLFMYDPETLEQTKFPTAYSNAYMQTKGVVDMNGKYWGVFQRSSTPEIITFDGTTEAIGAVMKAEESGSYVGFNLPEGGLAFVEAAYGKIKCAMVNPLSGQYVYYVKEGLPFEGNILSGMTIRTVTEDGHLLILERYSGSGEGGDLSKLIVHSFNLLAFGDYEYTKYEFVGDYSTSSNYTGFAFGELFGFLGSTYIEATDTVERGMYVFDRLKGTLELIPYEDFASSGPGLLTPHGEWMVVASGSPTGGCVDLVDPIKKTVRREQLGGTKPEFGFNVALRTSKGTFIYNQTTNGVVYKINFVYKDVNIDPSKLRSDLCQGRGR